jgi:quaternary ammonium compound-resistance protein SugE
MKAWAYLLFSGLFEVGWIVSLKLTQGFSRLGPIAGYAVCGGAAAWLLSLSLRTIPMGTAYAVWMAVSVVGTLLVDVLWFKQDFGVFRIACALLIVAGTSGLKAASSSLP